MSEITAYLAGWLWGFARQRWIDGPPGIMDTPMLPDAEAWSRGFSAGQTAHAAHETTDDDGWFQYGRRGVLKPGKRMG